MGGTGTVAGARGGGGTVHKPFHVGSLHLLIFYAVHLA